MVEERGEPFLLPLPCDLPYALQRLCHAFPVLRPARALLARIPLGLRPWLHPLRGQLPGFVRRLPSCRVGRGGAYALPLPARSNGSCSFPTSRFPVWAPLRRRRRIEVLQCQSTPPGYPRCRRRVFRKANLSALPSCTCPFLVIRLCHTVRGLPPPHGLLGPSGVVIPR